MKETPERLRAKAALLYIIPLLEERQLRWLITGGFACHVYGVDRPITDIDIDIDTTKDTEVFKDLYQAVSAHITQPLQHLVDENYDNYNFEITISGQIVDICPMKGMKVFDKATGKHEEFYENGFSRIEYVDFLGLRLPLLSKRMIIKNKEMLVGQRESDLRDIKGLQALF